MTPVEPDGDKTHDELIVRKRGLYRGVFTADAPHYGIAPPVGGVPGPRSAKPSGH
ncbi:hypothetical protein AB0G55_32760 [Streptomyces toyocaensis]|uniref:hypothetical protein n=1 Tax=Streptomyces toyocaensis TaxID=55952 RepID=UPI000B25FB05|nr:hypothetical protein [Streptomyces toyocaensis]